MAASLPAPLLKTSPKIGFAPSAAQAKMRLKWWKTDSPPHAKRKIPFRRKNGRGFFDISEATMKYMTKPESDSNEADWLL